MKISLDMKKIRTFIEWMEEEKDQVNDLKEHECSQFFRFARPVMFW